MPPVDRETARERIVRIRSELRAVINDYERGNEDRVRWSLDIGDARALVAILFGAEGAAAFGADVIQDIRELLPRPRTRRRPK